MHFRQAIVTKYIGPTNFKGSRIRAKCDAKSIIVNWDSSLGVSENHAKAALSLIHHLGWDTKEYAKNWIGGGIGDGYVFASTDGSLVSVR